MWLHTALETGLPPLEIPVWETALDGSRALTVRRHHYNFILTCWFRDLERVVAQLKLGGLIAGARPDRWPERWPEAPEYQAIVIPWGYEVMIGKLSFFDAGRTRRIFYSQFCEAETVAEALEAGRPAPAEAPTLLGRAEAWSRAFLDSLAAGQPSVRARRRRKRIRYRIVDEYEETWTISPQSSSQPLSLAELVRLIGTARCGGNDWEDLTGALRDSCGDPEMGLGFVTVSSEHYEDLDRYYAARARVWYEARVRERSVDPADTPGAGETP